MRLLHTSKITVETFPTPQIPYIPDYAIFSHRWGVQELSLQMMQQTPEPEGLREMEGYKKILKACEQAALVGFEYIWVDTCCIDKTNNVELTEALNSMFRWYRKSQVCYAYLSDVPSDEDPQFKSSKFWKSKWFTRGWTLQELLAPLYVVFFAEDWKEIGTKASLQGLISEATGIPSQVLLTNHGGEISVAQRMAWASKRETAMIEDQAYCLMGLFGVKMPMLYGEGENAFQRLQLEIMKTSDDQSIFAWRSDSSAGSRGLLAKSPREFQHCADIHRYGDESQTSAFTMTNKGLNISLPLLPISSSNDTFLGVLGCQWKQGSNYPDCYPLGIYVKREGDAHSQIYARVRTQEVKEIRDSVSFDDKTTICVRGTDPSRFDVVHWMQPEKQYIFSVRKCPSGHPTIMNNDSAQWTVNDDRIYMSLANSGYSAIMIFRDGAGQSFAVCLGVHNYNVWCDIMTDCGDMSIKKLGKEWWEGSRSGSRWSNLDRRTATFESGELVSLAVRKGRIEGKRAHIVDIDVGGDFHLDQLGPAVGFPSWDD